MLAGQGKHVGLWRGRRRGFHHARTTGRAELPAAPHGDENFRGPPFFARRLMADSLSPA